MTISFRNNSKTHFCTRYLEHFKEQKTLQQHWWYCKKAVDPENLIEQLIVTWAFQNTFKIQQ